MQVACGWSFTVCVTDRGQTFSWGAASVGQLGHPNKLRQHTAMQIAALKDTVISAVACGENHTLALARYGVTSAANCHLP